MFIHHELPLNYSFAIVWKTRRSHGSDHMHSTFPRSCDFYIALHACKQRQTAQRSSTVHGVQMPLSSEAWECTLSSLGSAAEIMVCFVGRALESSSCSVSSFSQASWEVGEKSCQLHWRCVQTKHFAQWSKTECTIVPELRVRKADVLSMGESWAGSCPACADQAGCLQHEIPLLFVLASRATLHHAESHQPPGRFLWEGSQQIFKKCLCHPKWIRVLKRGKVKCGSDRVNR